MDKDILSRIDEVTALACGQCDTPLAEDSPSLTFCSERCQALWSQKNGVPLLGRLVAGLDGTDYEGFVRRWVPSMDVASHALHRVAAAAAGLCFPQVFIAGIPDPGRSWEEWRAIGWGAGIPVRPEDHPAAEQVEPTRAQRMEVALSARRARNTGPAQRRRAPKTIGDNRR